jgi:peptide/nickel transport system substrate-binding protein
MKRLLLLLLVVCLTVPLAACGGGAGGDDATPVSEPDTESAGESIFRVTGPIMPKWDPAVGSDYASCVVLINAFDSLVFPTEDGGVEPWVAESWDISEDGLTWDFKIREDIYFHSGNQLTAHDVAYSMERLLEIGEGFAFLFYEYIDSVEVIDDFNVRFNCKTAYGPLLNSLVRFYIVDKELLETKYEASGDYGEKGDYGKGYLLEHDAGSGPYIVDSVSTNISVGGTKFKDYWAGFEENTPEKFIVYSSNDGVTVKTMMARQELESADMWQTTENITSMLASDDTFKLAYNYTGGGINLWMNNQRPPMDDKHVREAFGYLIDYATVCEQILPDSLRKDSVIPSNLLGFIPVFDYEFNLDKAQAALAKSEYADTIGDMEIELVWNSESADREKVALMVQAAASQIDLNVKIVELPWSTIVANSADMEMSPMTTLTSITPVSSDAGSQFVSMLRTKKVGTWENMNWVNDPVLDELIDRSLTLVDIDERAAAYREIQEYCGENFTFVPIAETPERLVYQSSYVELEPRIGLQGFSFYLRDIKVYPERRR